MDATVRNKFNQYVDNQVMAASNAAGMNKTVGIKDKQNENTFRDLTEKMATGC